jgi:hypothetical protein
MAGDLSGSYPRYKRLLAKCEEVRQLRALASDEAVCFEIERRDRLHSILHPLHRERKPVRLALSRHVLPTEEEGDNLKDGTCCLDQHRRN